MNIPYYLSPIKFYDTSLDENSLMSMSFNEYSKNKKETHHYNQKFLDKAEIIVYQDLLTGSYGFESELNWTLDTGSSLDKCKMDLVNINTFNIVTLGGNKLIIKIEGSGTITAGVFTETGAFTKDNPIIIDSTTGSTDVVLDGTFCVYGIAEVESTLDFCACGFDRVTDVEDITPYGSVYTIGTTAKTEFLPALTLGDIGNDYTDTHTSFSIPLDTDKAWSHYGAVKFFRIVFTEVSFDINVTASNDAFTDIKNAYDWNTTNNTLLFNQAFFEVPALTLEKIELYDVASSIITTLTATQTSQRQDPDYWYLVDGGGLVNSTNLEDATIQIETVLYSANDTIKCSLASGLNTVNIMNKESSSLKVSPGSTIAMADDNILNGQVVKINKIADINKYGCCIIEVGTYVSEPLEILTKEEARECDLVLLQYSNCVNTFGFINSFVGSMLVELELEQGDNEEADVFVQQTRNITLDYVKEVSRTLSNNIPLPSYLAEKLQKIFNLTDVKLDGKYYDIKDNSSKEQIDKSLLYNINVLLRERDVTGLF